MVNSDFKHVTGLCFFNIYSYVSFTTTLTNVLLLPKPNHTQDLRCKLLSVVSQKAILIVLHPPSTLTTSLQKYITSSISLLENFVTEHNPGKNYVSHQNIIGKTKMTSI